MCIRCFHGTSPSDGYRFHHPFIAVPLWPESSSSEVAKVSNGLCLICTTVPACFVLYCVVSNGSNCSTVHVQKSEY